MKKLYFLFLLVLVYSCGSKPETVSDTVKKDSGVKVPVKIDSLRKKLTYPKVMSVVRKTAYDDFYVRVEDSAYFCNYKGLFQSADTLGNRKSRLFDLKAGYLIDLVYFMPLSDNQFFVAWQETDHKGVFSHFAVYNRGKDTPAWKRSIKAHSPGQPVIDSSDVYISTLGMVGKVDIATGTLKWQHDSLFDPISLRFKQFERPILYTNTACFYDMPIKGKKNKRDTVWVNESSGKIVR